MRQIFTAGHLEKTGYRCILGSTLVSCLTNKHADSRAIFSLDTKSSGVADITAHGDGCHQEYAGNSEYRQV